LHGSLRGQVFESRMLDTLSRAGANIEMKTDGGAKVLQIAGAGVTLCMEDSALALPAGETLLRGLLYRPPHSNNASWDALIVEDDPHGVLAADDSVQRASGQTERARRRKHAAASERVHGLGATRVFGAACRV
jgi:hypothetical protein